MILNMLQPCPVSNTSILNLHYHFLYVICSSDEISYLEKILTILLRQPSRLLQELFAKQQNMIHVVVGLCQGLTTLSF